MTNHLKQAIQKNKEVIFPVKDGEEMDILAKIIITYWEKSDASAEMLGKIEQLIKEKLTTSTNSLINAVVKDMEKKKERIKNQIKPLKLKDWDEETFLQGKLKALSDTISHLNKVKEEL